MDGGRHQSHGQQPASRRPGERAFDVFQPGVISVWALALCLWPSFSSAQVEDSDLTAGGRGIEVEEPVEEVPFEGDIGLDQLLKLPSDGAFATKPRQGANAQTWRRRFAEAARAVDEAQLRIKVARDALDEMSASGSASQWQMAPPGQSASTDVAPMSLKQREEIRAGKEQLAQAERAQRALVIEADLAGVPQSWRVPVGAGE